MKRGILWVGRLFVIVIYAVLLAYAVIVGMAFVLKLLGANPDSDFADWVYRAAANITQPFRGIFPTTELATSDHSVFDASLLFALMVYLVAAVVLHAIINWLTRQITGIDKERALEQQLELQRQQAALGVGPTVATTTMPVTPTIPAATEPVPTTWAEPAPAAVATPWPSESPTVAEPTTATEPLNPPSANPPTSTNP
jgi:hypothetical protein